MLMDSFLMYGSNLRHPFKSSLHMRMFTIKVRMPCLSNSAADFHGIKEKSLRKVDIP